MRKNYPSVFSKVVSSLLTAIIFCVSCTKSYDPGIVLNDRSALLTGQPGSVNWILNTVKVNSLIDNTAKGALKTYRPDGTFTDDLGFTGYWTLSSGDSLIESTRSSVNPAAPYFSNHYHIDRLDRGQLELTYTNADKTIRLVYESNK